MSFDFNSINPINKAQATYKDGGGLGGGGMYMRQGRKRQDDEDDIFEYGDNEQDNNELEFDNEDDVKNIPTETFFNKFVNWFRIQKK